MSLRLIALATLLVACGGETTSTRHSKEPKNAKQKQRLEAQKDGEEPETKHTWGKGWKYSGDRNDCFYVLGSKCFKTEKLACAEAKCKAPKKCDVVGGGPATVSCK